MAKAKLTEEMKKEITEHYKEFSDTYFAKKFEVNKFTIASYRFKHHLIKSPKKSPTKKIFDKELNFIKENIDKMTIQELADKLGVSYKTVTNIISQNGFSLVREYNKLTDKQKDQIRKEYYQKNMTIKALANKYGVSKDNIYRTIRSKKGINVMELDDNRKKNLFDITKFNKKLEKIMKIKGLTKQKMSIDCGFDPSYLSLIMKKNRYPTLDFVLKLSAVYKISLDQLFDIKFGQKKEDKNVPK